MSFRHWINTLRRSLFGVSVRGRRLSGRRIYNGPTLELLEDRLAPASIAVFDNGSYVDTAGGISSESDNIQASLILLGHSVTTFTGIDAASINAALAGKDIVVIPELETGDLNAALSGAAKTAFANFVASGGGLIINGEGSSRDEAFLNGVFGFSVAAGSSSSGSLTTNAVGTAFAGGPSTLPANNGTYGQTVASQPPGAKPIYDGGSNTILTLIPYAEGQIAFLAFDWYDAAPVGSQNGGWLTVLGSTVTQLNTQPGTLDLTFGGGDGIVTASIGSADDYASSLVVDAAGNYVVAGYTFNGSNYDFTLTRYTSAGVLDATFGGGDGVVSTAIGSADEKAYSVTVDGDSNYLVAGNSFNGSNNDFALARYTAAGVLDTTFGGGDGIVITPIGSTHDGAYSVAVDALGYYVVAGYTFNGSNYDFALARYTAAGILDTTFGGGDGITTTPIGSLDDHALSVAVDAAGNYIVAGYSNNGSSFDFALTRYTSAGALDTTFGGGDGIVTSSIGSAHDYAYSVAVDGAGKYVVAGYTFNGSNNDFVLVRYTEAGVLDATFGGGDGIVTNPIGAAEDIAVSVAVDIAGKYVVAGYTYYGSNADFALARYTATGALDPTFGGGDGIVTTPIGSSDDVAVGVAVDNAGKYVVAGYSHTGSNNDFVLARYEAGGTLSATITGGSLTITDNDATGKENNLTVSFSGGSYIITDANEQFDSAPPFCTLSNGGRTLTVPSALINGSFTFNTGGGNDTLTVALSGGDAIPLLGIFFNGGNPTTEPGDKLVITGGSQGNVTYNFTNAHDGSIVMSTFGTITYTGLEPIINSGTAADVIFNLPTTGNIQAILEDDGTIGNLLSRFRSSPVAFEQVDFTAPTGSLTINRGSESDDLTVNALPDFHENLTIGTAVNPFDTLTFNGAVALGGFQNLTAFTTGTISFPNAASDVSTISGGSISLTTASNIVMASGSSITTANGNLTLSANQQTTPSTGNFIGIDVNGATVQVTGTGAIIAAGRGGNDSAGEQTGLMIRNGGKIQGGTTGSTSVTGTGGAGSGHFNGGVVVVFSGSAITSIGGSVSVTGAGGGTGTGTSNRGVEVNGGGQLTAGGIGTVNVVGTGGNTSGSGNVGVYVIGAGALITSGGGAVVVNGTGGGNGNSATGVEVISGGQLSAGGAGTVTVAGSGNANPSNGVRVSGAGSQITSGGGSIQISGTAGTGVVSLAFEASATITTATNGGDVLLIGDTMDISADVSANSAGRVTVRQVTNNVMINLGGADVSGSTLGLTDAELDRITAGTLRIGDANSGAITVTAAVNPGAAPTLRLTTGSTVTATPPGIGVTNLAVIAGGTINITLGSVTKFAAVTTSGSVTFSGDPDGFSVDTVDGQAGVSAPGNITLTTTGSSSDLTVTAGDTVTSTAGGNISINADRTVTLSANVSTNGSGTLTVSGLSGAGAGNISVTSGVNVTTASGLLTLDADRGSQVTGDFHGVQINGATVRSTAGSVMVQGRGGNGTLGFGNQYGIRLVSAGKIWGGGAGTTTTVVGIAGASGGNSNYGLYANGSGTNITSDGGDISVTGNSQGGLSEAMGVNLTFFASVAQTTGAGNVTVTGTGGTSSGGNNHGVAVTVGAFITSAGGNVLVTGTAGNGGGSHGVNMDDGGLITAGGGGGSTATTTVIGTGGTVTNGGSLGVFMQLNPRIGGNTSGAVSVTGTSNGVGGNNFNPGIYMNLNANIQSYGVGAVTVTGTGSQSNFGPDQGVSLLNGAYITSGTGPIVVNGSTSSTNANSFGISVGSAGTGTISSGGPVTLNADTIELHTTNATVSAGSNTATLRPLTASRAINLGGADVAGSTLGLTDGEIDRVTAGTLAIGNSSSGSITISAAITRAASTSVVFTSGGNIVFNPGSLNTGGGALSLTPGAAGSVQPTSSGVEITTSASAALSFGAGADLAIAINGATVDTQYRQLNVAGQVNLAGVDLVLSGSYMPTASDSFIIVNNDASDAILNTFNGLAEGAAVNVNGVTKLITYLGGTGNDVALIPGPQVTAFTVNGNDAALTGTQRSRVTNLKFTFDQAITLDAGAFSLSLHPNVTINGVPGQTVGTIPTLAWSTSDGGLNWVITFSGAVDSGSIRDGVYDLLLDHTKVHLVSNPAITMAASYTQTFHRLFGDNEGNGSVNISDYSAFVSAFGKSVGNPLYKAWFDFDNNGTINISDYSAFVARFGKSYAY